MQGSGVVARRSGLRVGLEPELRSPKLWADAARTRRFSGFFAGLGWIGRRVGNSVAAKDCFHGFAHDGPFADCDSSKQCELEVSEDTKVLINEDDDLVSISGFEFSPVVGDKVVLAMLFGLIRFRLVSPKAGDKRLAEKDEDGMDTDACLTPLGMVIEEPFFFGLAVADVFDEASVIVSIEGYKWVGVGIGGQQDGLLLHVFWRPVPSQNDGRAQELGLEVLRIGL